MNEFDEIGSGGISHSGSSTVEAVYNTTTVGGTSSGGLPLIKATYKPIVSGGTSSGGLPLIKATYKPIVSGGTSSGGLPLIKATYKPSISGSLLSGGSSIIKSVSKDIISSGGITISGQSKINALYFLIVDSFGLAAIGLVENFAFYNENFIGGVQNAGLAEIISGYIMQDGINSGGDAAFDFTFNLTTDAGVAANGNIEVNADYQIEVEGFALSASGESFIQIIWLPSGSIFASGSAYNDLGFSPLGGAISSGNPYVTSSVNEPVKGISTGGLRVEGNNPSVHRRFKFFTASGSVEVQGSAECAITDAKFIPKGSIETGSKTLVNFTFKNSLKLNYNINAKIEKSLSFNWNTGELPIYWYRVVGKGVTDPCLPNDPCCQKMILNVHARSLSDLCQKLSKRRYKFPIDFVQKYNRPAQTTYLNSLEAAGQNFDCNNLVDVEICKIPQCADFCVEQDLREVVGFNMSVSINAAYGHVANGLIYAVGNSEINFVPNIPKFYHIATGFVAASASAELKTNSYTSRGGIKLGGSSRLQSSRWSYVGGKWPDSTGYLNANTSESVSQSSNEQVWSLTDRVFENDNLYTSTDVSFQNNSQLLVIKGFDLVLPPFTNLFGINLAINRVATKTGVRDYEIYLLQGSERVSQNLAVTGIDWPLIETQRVYGPNWRPTQTNSEFDSPLTNTDLLPDFGVAIKVKSNSNLTATIARIDSVQIELLYEDPQGSLIRLSSDSGATAKSSSYSYTASGRIFSGTETSYKKSSIWKSIISSAGVRLAGQFNLPIFRTMSGGARLSGEAQIRPYYEVPVGGSKVSGSGEVKPYLEIMSGGILISPKSKRSGKMFRKYISQGGVFAIGQAFTPEKLFKYTSSMIRPLSVSGEAKIRKQKYVYQATGGMFISGGQSYIAGDLSIPFESMLFRMNVRNMSAVHAEDYEIGGATGVTTPVEKCGCLNLPLLISFSQNFSKDNILAKFLVRNNLAISRNLRLRFNKSNNSWQYNLHFKGLGADSNNVESWDIITELQCTDLIGGTQTGRTIWKLAIQFFRKNLSNKNSSSSRILVSILPDTLCNNIAAQLDFLVTYNTQTQLCFVNPNSVIYFSSLFDNIGLFSNRAWIENPNLQLRISQLAPQNTQTRLNLTEAVLV